MKLDKIAAFKRWLEEPAEKPGGDAKGYSASTIVHTLGDLKALYEWLGLQPGYRSMKRDIAEYFSPSKRHSALSRVPKHKFKPSPEQLHLLLETMPTRTWQERRDRAVIALLFLTGGRDGAII